LADVSLALGAASTFGFDTNAANAGPRVATSIQLKVAQTPYSLVTSGNSCQGACAGPPQLASGETARAFYDTSIYSEQRYVTISATAHQRDPNPSNNTLAYTSRPNIAMDALYLTPGATAHVSFYNFAKTTVNVESSNPVAVSAPATADGSGMFVVQGLALGTSVIRVYSGNNTIGSLSVDVLAPGTKPRWPGAIDYSIDNGYPFDQPTTIHVYTSGTSPFDGKTATGTVTFTMGSRELGKVTLDSRQRSWLLPAYLEKIGDNTITMTYGGDANFAPIAKTSTARAEIGHVSIGANIEDHGTSATLHVRITGSPMSAPKGTISVVETSTTPSVSAPLTPGSAAVSAADVTLTGLTPGVHTFRVNYSGDPFYAAGVQEFREVAVRKPAARH
jgi:hypothetical protein